MLAVGPTRYCHGGYCKFGRYGSGELAIQIFTEDGQPQLKATVSLMASGADDPGTYGCWIKDWSENEGIAEALVKSGIVALTGKSFKTGFVEAKHAILTPAGRAALKEGGGP